jgi:hypothetical protein
VTRTGGSTGSVNVNWSAISNTATLGTDLGAPGGVLTFGSGITSQTFSLSITNDTAAEGNESAHLALSSPGGGAILGKRSRALLTIIDNDLAITGFNFSTTNYTSAESGSKAIVITRSASTTAQSVTFATSDNGTASSGADYSSVSSVINFAIGETSKTVNIAVLPDQIVEGTESVNLTLSNPTGGGTLGARKNSLFIINDDDNNGVLQFKLAAFTVAENSSTATITVTRTSGTFGAIGVKYATSDNTAVKGSDYTDTTGTLTLAQGEISKNFTIPILNDSNLEGAESLNLTLSNATGGATLGRARRAVLIITDND